MDLKFDLHNCYGIGHLDDTIHYTNNTGNTAIVYAPNGSMKTSLTKTIKQLIAGKDPCDEFYRNRVTTASITLDGTPIDKENTYVFDNTNADGEKQISVFLANSVLKTQYDVIYKLLDTAKKTLAKHLKSIAKSSDCEDEILDAFRTNKEDNFFDCLFLIKTQIAEGAEVLEGFDFRFNDVFDRSGKVKNFINENQSTIQLYFKKYTELIKGSKFFNSTAKFGTTQANSLLKSVTDNRYFNAGHKFTLSGGEKHKSIISKDEMERVIKDELDRIFKDDDIKHLFNELESKLDKNSSLKGFKDVIQDNPELIPELVDYDEFQRKILRGYLKQCEVELAAVTNLYVEKKDELREIIKRANNEQSQWEKVIDLFNSRFYVPFKLILQNKSDILLNLDAPELQFLYKDGSDEPVMQDRKDLLENLSEGEKRAFYILQNIFEIEARSTRGQETLLVFDDIADSFDYKNKYAIIEYLNDLRRNSNFRLLILTHNFDFYRTVVSRLEVNIAMVVSRKENDRTISLKPAFYKQDILKRRLLDKITCRNAFIACIPFARNIIEYTHGDTDEYKFLTACLHLKKDKTVDITLGQIQVILSNVFNDVRKNANAITFSSDNYLTALMDEAEQVIKDNNDIDIVNKLILSMAIRLKAESYMQSQLTSEQLHEMQVNVNQTAEMLNVFRKYHETDKNDECLLMNKVLMLTSENIHMNNFMFEPLVDISIHHLKQLYNEMKGLLAA